MNVTGESPILVSRPLNSQFVLYITNLRPVGVQYVTPIPL